MNLDSKTLNASAQSAASPSLEVERAGVLLNALADDCEREAESATRVVRVKESIGHDASGNRAYAAELEADAKILRAWAARLPALEAAEATWLEQIRVAYADVEGCWAQVRAANEAKIAAENALYVAEKKLGVDGRVWARIADVIGEARKLAWKDTPLAAALAKLDHGDLAAIAAKLPAEGASVLAVDRSRSSPNQLQSNDLPIGEDTING